MSESHSSIRSRLAPTPSGFLHIGNVLSFVLTWIFVRQNNGHLHLRIDDLDHERVRPQYVDNIFEILEWLGLSYDSGPSGSDDFYKNHSQSLRMSMYKEGLDALKNSDLLFSCQCTRKDIGSQVYLGTCRHDKALDFQKNTRIEVSDKNVGWLDELRGTMKIDLAKEMGDFVVWRKNGLPSYQLASVIDDIEFGTNCVIRGAGLVQSTAAQIYLSRFLSKNTFAENQFLHHPLITFNDTKMSKSQSHPGILEQFKSPKEVFLYLGGEFGLAPDQSENLDLLREYFSLENYNTKVHV